MGESGQASGPAPLQVGWVLDSGHATFLYDAPRRVTALGLRPGEGAEDDFDSVVVDEEWPYFEVVSPYSLSLKPVRDRQGRFQVVNTLRDAHSPGPAAAQQAVAPVAPELWRSPQRPVVQIATPFRLISDEAVWVTQLPPFATPEQQSWPGAFVPGRFPVQLWPRMLSWAFEWHDPTQELVLREGEPWFYLKFESQDPIRRIEMVEARMTPALRRYCQGLDGVVHFVKRTYSLFEVARRRRPERLLEPLDHDTAGEEEAT